MKTVKKIFTALFMIAPFYGAVADISEYEECISDIEQEIFSGHMESAFGDSGFDSLLRKKHTLSDDEKTELKKQIKAVADKVLDTPITESRSGKCNGIPYTINIGDTLRQKMPQACHELAYAEEQEEVEENFAKNKCQHLKTTATSEESSSSSNPRAGRNDKNRANERETTEPENLEPSVATPPSFGNDMKTPPVAPETDEESDDDTTNSTVETHCRGTGGDWDIKADKCICQPPLRPNANDMFCYDPRPNCKKEKYSHSKTVTWNGATNECEVTCDDDFYFRTQTNQCEPKGCEVKDKDPNAISGEIRDGKCIITACDFGYDLTEQSCTENLCKRTGGEPLKRIGTPKETCNCGDRKWEDGNGCVEKTKKEIATKKAPVATTINLDNFYKKYCDNEGYYTDNTFQTPSYADFKDNCKAKKPFIIVSCYKWKNKDLSAITEELKHYCSTETENRVEVGDEKRPKTHVKKDETSNTTTPTQQECTPEKVGNGAAEVKWVSDKCNIVKCNTNTYEETPVDGKCVSKAYKTASQKLSELLKQAQAALEKIKEPNNKTNKS